ncbi:MAG: hypothetical protein H6R19_3781 [Proteobacteria bacterium]|nr:hypothetical protein [Pseudomonadota bacterium]
MKCLICKVGETRPGRATVTLERNNVPADICANCGEEYVNSETTELLLRTAEEAVKSRVQLSVRDYVAADLHACPPADRELGHPAIRFVR